MSNINKLFAFNVNYLAEKKDLKIGDIERDIGVSIGYISRLKHGGNVSLKMAYEAARILDVSIDDLCTDIRLKDIQKIANELGYKLVPVDDDETAEEEDSDV